MWESCWQEALTSTTQTTLEATWLRDLLHGWWNWYIWVSFHHIGTDTGDPNVTPLVTWALQVAREQHSKCKKPKGSKSELSPRLLLALKHFHIKEYERLLSVSLRVCYEGPFSHLSRTWNAVRTDLVVKSSKKNPSPHRHLMPSVVAIPFAWPREGPDWCT